MTPDSQFGRNRRRGHRARALALPVGFALALFVLVELTTRIFLFGWAGLNPLRVDSVKPIGRTAFLQPSEVPGLAFELKPNLDGYFKLARFRTNGRGLRDREYSALKPEGAFRVAVVGGSYTMASGVPIERAFHSILEARLGSSSGERAYEFINFAVGSYLPRQNLAVLEHKALRFAPDLVLFGVTDMAVPLLVRTPFDVEYVPRPVSHPFFDSFTWPLWKAKAGHAGPVNAWNAMREGEALQRSESDQERNIVDQLGRVSRERGIPIFFARIEYEADKEPVPNEQQLRRSVADNGMHYVDTRSAFRGFSPAQLRINDLDRHPNARAHAIFADVIEGALREKRLLPQSDGE